MKQFNLEEYLKNPSRKVVTRDGRPVRIICTNKRVDSIYNFSVIGLITLEDETEVTAHYTKYGGYLPNGYFHYFDLFFADEIPDFKPYDRVLTRGHSGLPWKANLFSNFKKQGDNTIAVCLKGDYLLNDIIPFDENKVGKIE